MPILPLELVEDILMESVKGDGRVFKAKDMSDISILSRSLRNAVNNQRFADCTIWAHRKNLGNRIMDKLVRLANIIAAPVWSAEDSVARHVRGVKVVFGGEGVPTRLIPLLSSILNAVFNTRSRHDRMLHLTTMGRPFSFATLTPELMEALHGACMHPSLSRLIVYRITDIPLYLFDSHDLSTLSFKQALLCHTASLAIVCTPPARLNTESLTPLWNLRSLTYDSDTDIVRILSQEHPPHYLKELNIMHKHDTVGGTLIRDLKYLGQSPHLTSLSIAFTNGLRDCPNSLDYNYLRHMTHLSLRLDQTVGISDPTGTAPLFAYLTPLLPRHPQDGLYITLEFWVNFHFNATHASNTEAALRLFHERTDEAHLITYLEASGILSRRVPDPATCLPFTVNLNVAFIPIEDQRRFRLDADPCTRMEHEIYLTTLFSRLNRLNGVCLSGKIGGGGAVLAVE